MNLQQVIALAIFIFFTTNVFGSLSVKNRGGCMVITLRDAHVKSNLESRCDQIHVEKFANGQSFLDKYKWVPAFLAYSFDQAERASCGFIGCATDKLQVTLLVVPNGVPTAGVSMSDKQMNLFINVGLIDFIDASSRSYWADVVDILSNVKPNRGYAKWVSSMRESGKNCHAYFDAPKAVLSEKDFPTVQTVAQATYQVVFGHELAHYLSGDGACAGKPPGLRREMACDKISINSLLNLKNSTMMPGGVVAVLMALDTYSRVAGPAQFGILGAGPTADSVREQIASLPWNTRAEQVVDLWDHFCRSGASSKVCPAGYDDLIITARELAERPPPADCAP